MNFCSFKKSIPLFFKILNLKKTVLLHRQKFKFLKINKNTNYEKKELKKILKINLEKKGERQKLDSVALA